MATKSQVRVIVRMRPIHTLEHPIDQNGVEADAVCVQYDDHCIEVLQNPTKTPILSRIPTLVSLNVNTPIKDDHSLGVAPLRSPCALPPSPASVEPMETPNSVPFHATLPHRFHFDAILPPSHSQTSVYACVCRPLVEMVLRGYNATLLAHGPTGSGKTHSLFGPPGNAVWDWDPNAEGFAECGMMARAVSDLLDALQPAERSVRLTLSAFEIYRETITDLLGGAEAGEPRIREDAMYGRGVYVESLQRVECRGASQVAACVSAALRRRRRAPTHTNTHSSRSHCLMDLSVEQTALSEGGGVMSSRLYLVDLAGSEKVCRTLAKGARLKEAQAINLSLTVLGNVIHRLTDGRGGYVPYRDSKLTRLLTDALGGNALTTLLCHITPATRNREETLATLRFAARAKRVRNKPRVNRQLTSEEMRVQHACAMDRIQHLEEQIQVQNDLITAEEGISELQQLRATVDSLLGQVEELKSEGYTREEELQHQRDATEHYKILHSKASKELELAASGEKRLQDELESAEKERKELLEELRAAQELYLRQQQQLEQQLQQEQQNGHPCPDEGGWLPLANSFLHHVDNSAAFQPGGSQTVSATALTQDAASYTVLNSTFDFEKPAQWQLPTSIQDHHPISANSRNHEMYCDVSNLAGATVAAAALTVDRHSSFTVVEVQRREKGVMTELGMQDIQRAMEAQRYVEYEKQKESCVQGRTDLEWQLRDQLAERTTAKEEEEEEEEEKEVCIDDAACEEAERTMKTPTPSLACALLNICDAAAVAPNTAENRTRCFARLIYNTLHEVNAMVFLPVPLLASFETEWGAPLLSGEASISSVPRDVLLATLYAAHDVIHIGENVPLAFSVLRAVAASIQPNLSNSVMETTDGLLLILQQPSDVEAQRAFAAALIPLSTSTLATLRERRSGGLSFSEVALACRAAMGCFLELSEATDTRVMLAQRHTSNVVAVLNSVANVARAPRLTSGEGRNPFAALCTEVVGQALGALRERTTVSVDDSVVDLSAVHSRAELREALGVLEHVLNLNKRSGANKKRVDNLDAKEQERLKEEEEEDKEDKEEEESEGPSEQAYLQRSLEAVAAFAMAIDERPASFLQTNNVLPSLGVVVRLLQSYTDGVGAQNGTNAAVLRQSCAVVEEVVARGASGTLNGIQFVQSDESSEDEVLKRRRETESPNDGAEEETAGAPSSMTWHYSNGSAKVREALTEADEVNEADAWNRRENQSASLCETSYKLEPPCEPSREGERSRDSVIRDVCTLTLSPQNDKEHSSCDSMRNSVPHGRFTHNGTRSDTPQTESQSMAPPSRDSEVRESVSAPPKCLTLLQDKTIQTDERASQVRAFRELFCRLHAILLGGCGDSNNSNNANTCKVNQCTILPEHVMMDVDHESAVAALLRTVYSTREELVYLKRVHEPSLHREVEKLRRELSNAQITVDQMEELMQQHPTDTQQPCDDDPHHQKCSHPFPMRRLSHTARALRSSPPVPTPLTDGPLCHTPTLGVARQEALPLLHLRDVMDRLTRWFHTWLARHTQSRAREAEATARAARLGELLETTRDAHDTCARELDAWREKATRLRAENTAMREVLDALHVDLAAQMENLRKQRSANMSLQEETVLLKGTTADLCRTAAQIEFCEMATTELQIKTRDLQMVREEIAQLRTLCSKELVERKRRLLGVSLRQLGVFIVNLSTILHSQRRFNTGNLETQRLTLLKEAKSFTAELESVRKVHQEN